MKLEIKHENELYEIELLQITQLGGMNIKKKTYMVQSLVKYFSNSKYMDYERKMWNNIRITNQEVGRKYFDLIYVKNKQDVINMLKITKTSIMVEYIRSLVHTFEMQIELDKVENALVEIYNKLNLDVEHNFSSISFDYDQEKIMDIINCTKMQGIDGNEIESIDAISLLKDLLVLVEKLQKQTPKKQLFILENIDHMVNFQEYCILYELVRELTRKCDVWFLFTSSVDEFIVFEKEYFRGINIVNDIIFSFPEVERMKGFIEKRYPVFIKLSEEELLQWLRNIVQKIGKENICSHMKANVILKLLNDSLCVEYDVKNILNSMENSFLLS